MQIQVDISFNQLVQIMKNLSLEQWTKLKNEVENNESKIGNRSGMEDFLMCAPTFSENQIRKIKRAGKEIGQWRKK